MGTSSYNSLQLSAEKRFSNSLSFLAAYTYGNSIDEGNGGNSSGGDNGTNIQTSDPHEARGLSAFDYRQRFSFGYTYELPFGRGRRFMNSLPVALDAILGGWQFNGILTAQTGFPFTVQMNNPARFQRRPRSQQRRTVHQTQSRLLWQSSFRSTQRQLLVRSALLRPAAGLRHRECWPEHARRTRLSGLGCHAGEKLPHLRKNAPRVPKRVLQRAQLS